MKRAASLLALLASACTTMEPRYVRPDPAIPASWPVGDPYLAQAEVGLPVLTYSQVFQDPRLQTLIAEALANNRDLMIAASNIAAAREQYHIQRAQLLPTVNAGAGVTVSGDKSGDVKADYNAGVQVPNFAGAYMKAVLSQPHVAEWIDKAQDEPWVIDQYESRKTA